MDDEAITGEDDVGEQQLAISKGNLTFEFLKLPPELRNMIYGYALVNKRHRCLFTKAPLTSVNKQIRSESLAVFYRDSKFAVQCIEDVAGNDQPDGLYRLREQWKVPGVPAVSAVPFWDLVTKLNIRYCFTDAWDDLNFEIYMTREWPVAIWEDGEILGDDPGVDWKKPFEAFRKICRQFLRDELRWTALGFCGGCDDLAKTVLRNPELVNEVFKILIFFAEKCSAAAAGYVWMSMRSDMASHDDYAEKWCDTDTDPEGGEC